MEQLNLTFPQKNIFLVDALNKDTSLNVIAGTFKISKNYDSEICKKIINEVIRSNDGLRIKIIKGETPHQQVKKYENVNIDVIDMTGKSEKEVDEYLEKQTNSPIDMFSDDLVRFLVITTSKDSGIIYLKLHHIVGDAWTLRNIVNQLFELYQKSLNNEDITSIRPSYTEYIKTEEEYLNSDKYKNDEKFWSEYLSGIKAPVSLKEGSFVSTRAKRYSVQLTKKENDRLLDFAKSLSASPYTVFLSALATYFYRVKDVNDIVIGTPILNRSNFKEKNMMGCFISTIPLRMKIEENMKFVDLVKKTATQTMSLFRHQKFPISNTIENVHANEDIKGKIYNLILSYQNARSNLGESEYFSTNWLFSGHIQDELEIHVLDMDNTGMLRINYDYLADAFEDIEIEYLHTRLMAIIESAEDNADVSVENLRIMTKEEENKILYEFNNTERDYPKESTVIELFEEQVIKTPHNIALVFENKSMTYKELNDKANSLASYLREKYYLKQGDFAGILIDKSFELIIAIIALLKLGVCYVPIEKSHLLERKRFILKNSNSKLVILDEDIDVDIPKVNIYTSNYSNINIKENIKNSSKTDSPNCVLYTSGTTGEPKGAVIVDRNIIKLVKNADYIEFNNKDRILQAASTSFDVSLFEIWGALLNGGQLHIMLKENLITPSFLKEYLASQRITILWITSALFNQMIEYDAKMFTNIRRLFTGGDVISINHVRKLKSTIPNINLTNCYGPTECTTFTNVFNIEGVPNSKIPIGKPISNTKGYVVDKKLRLLPIMVEGEYVLAGESVALGYINNEELSKKKFIENIFPNNFGIKRMYRTGDIVKMLADGNIDFIGRADNQVKIRGMRIELDEIKNCFMRYPNVKDCVLVVKNSKIGKCIYLYFTATEKLDIESVNKYLRSNLLSHLVPAGIMQLDNLPINRNGKVDRNSLPEIKHTIVADNEITKLEGDLIGTLNEMFDVALNKGDNLLNLGIDSLAMIRYITKINEKFNVEISISKVLQNPNVQNIAKLIQDFSKKSEIIDYKSNILPAQKGIFMQYMINTESTLYNIPFEISFEKGKIDVEKLKNAIIVALKNHRVLFSSFDIAGGDIMLKYNDVYEYDIKIINTDKQKYSELKSKFVKPFDLLKGPLFKIEIYLVDENVYVLFDFHHIVFDGASMLIFLKDVAMAYDLREVEREKLEFDEYVKNRKIRLNDIEFYKEMFKEEPSINDLPYDRKRSKKMDNKGNKIYVNIPMKISNKIQSYINNNKFTANSVMQSAFTILMAKYMYSEDITFGIAHSARNESGLDNSIGMYVKTMPYRQVVKWDMGIKGFILESQRKILEIMSHDSVTYEEIIKEIDIPRFNNRNPLFDVMFVYQSIAPKSIEIAGSKVTINEIMRNNSKFDITFEVIPSKDGFTITAEYKTLLFDASTIEGIIGNYINILKYITTNENAKLCDIDMISAEERYLIVDKFNSTKTNYPFEMPIHKIFEKVVEKFGEKTAIVFNNEKITYGALNSKANRLARLLIECGIKKGDTVGIMIDKSSEYMVALLGALKAGAVYMPISADMPEERVKYVLSDANAKAIITTKKFDRDVAGDIHKIYISIKDENSDYMHISEDTNLNIDVSSGDRAYVMYTSGTTGVPKGVVIAHRGITRLLLNTNLVNYSERDEMLVSGSVTFDTSLFEIWGAMFYGMTLHFIEKKNILNPAYYESYLLENNITTTLIPTPIFNMLTEYNSSMFRNLTSLYVGGDVLYSNYANEILEKCPSLKLVNIYGPTENAVISTFELVNEKTIYDVSIGKPISNSVCYVVDKCGKLCPVHVPGELYTGGDGLALGYINKDEVTKEKFTYYSETGSKIYKTGDLASFEKNGKIKFWGRIDTQIKLRGQRIEILEITNKILELDGVTQCIIILKENNNSKYLVAYYTSKFKVTEKQIDKYLRRYLPSYMIPSVIVHLKEMPLNQNGKIDRKLLPDVKFDKATLIEPVNEIQSKILEIYKQVLLDDDIGMNSNFFDVGGDSLLAMKLVGKMEENDIHISYADVYEYQTPLGIYKKIHGMEEKNIQNFGIDISKYDYSRIENLLKNRSIINLKPINSVFLTGVTGFLGVHILDNLIEYNSNIRVYCLIRPKRGISPEDRMKRILKFYFGNKYANDRYRKNIVLVYGDITNPKIIFNQSHEKDIIRNCDVVINSAAHVHHFGENTIFEEINIKGVNNIAAFCAKNNKKMVHISTLSVSGNLLEGGQISQKHIKDGTIYDEKSLYIGQDLSNVYALSKFIGERSILEKVESGNLNAVIIRVGNLTGRFSDGKAQINIRENAFINRIRTFKNLGIVPKNILDLDVEFSPVDLVAKSIIRICNMRENNIIYHVYNPNHIKLSSIVNILNDLNIKIKCISQDEMTDTIKSLMKDSIRHGSISGIIQDLDSEKQLKYESNIKISCTSTIKQLEKYKFKWPYIDKEYILKFFDKIGIIEKKEEDYGNK